MSAAALFIGMIVWTGYVQAERNTPVAQAWDYKKVYADKVGLGGNERWRVLVDDREMQLANPQKQPSLLAIDKELGSQGWELISIDSNEHYYKRPK